jgi:integrase/recombinase XerD
MKDYNLPKDILKWLEDGETMQNKSEGTINEYASIMKLLLEFMKKKKRWTSELSEVNSSRLNNITLEDLEDFMFDCKKQGQSDSTRSKKVIVIQECFQYLKGKRKVISLNPAIDLDRPKVGKRLPHPLSTQKCRELLIHIRTKNDENMKRDFAVVTFCLNLGLRVSEIEAININQIKDNALRVIGKGNKEREVYLNPECLKAMNEYLEERPISDDPALFLSKQGKRLTKISIQKMVKKYLIAIGEGEESIHSLRHSYATMMAEVTSVPTLQELMGHASPATTMIYVKINSEQKRAASLLNPLNVAN